MQLSDLKNSITELNDNELRDLLSSIRANRRISKRPPVAGKKKSTLKAEVSTEALMNNMSVEQAEKLLKMMEGK